MNRIILIGNGFDLAHGMKTSYNHFMSYYWEKAIQDLKNSLNRNATSRNIDFKNGEIRIDNVSGGPYNGGHWVEGVSYEDLTNILNIRRHNLIFENKFLEKLTTKHKERNWVDIENEYYDLLKDSFKNQRSKYKIEELNKDLDRIKQLLESYLVGVEDNFVESFGRQTKDARLINNIGEKIYSPFKLRDFKETSINKKAEFEFQKMIQDLEALKNNSHVTIDEFSEDNQKIISQIGTDGTINDIRELLLSSNAHNYFDLIPNEILFLNFNYTATEKLYSDQAKFNSSRFKKISRKANIHIHGTTVKEDNNQVIFGFGDEIDEDYKSIENLNDNAYLENIKSIKYLETDNYKQLLEFLNAGDFQIFIFGHSCGISDRTLLNTLFEHKNCSSIKPFYHSKEDGTDNYSDIVRNISRNFNSKADMRDKVVNKKYCEPLS